MATFTVIILNNQKNAIIEKTTKQINELKENLLSLIDKIKELKENQKLIDETKKEILIKNQKLQERAQENKNLRNEKKKLIQGFRQEKTNIILNKDFQIKSLSKKLEYAESYQQKLLKEEKEKAIYRNKYKEVKLHIETLLTENERLACIVAQLNADNYNLSERYKKLAKQPICVIEVHPLKALSPILSRDAGSHTFFRLLQPSKALALIVRTPFCISSFLICDLSTFLKISCPIAFTS